MASIRAATDASSPRDQPAGPDVGLSEHERVVQQRQGLGGHVRHVAPALRHLAAGEIERAEELRRLHQVVLDVDAAAAVAVERAGEQAAVGILLLAKRLDAHPVQRAVEPARRGQDRNRESPRPPAAGPDNAASSRFCGSISLRRGGGWLASWKVRVSTSDADQPLHRPAFLDERGGQVVEQLGVRRQFADVAEVVDRADQAGAEQMMPDAVDHHPRRQRIVGAGDPLGQFQPAAARRGERVARRRQHFEIASRRRRRPAAVQSPRTKTGCSKPGPPSATPGDNARQRQRRFDSAVLGHQRRQTRRLSAVLLPSRPRRNSASSQRTSSSVAWSSAQASQGRLGRVARVTRRRQSSSDVRLGRRRTAAAGATSSGLRRLGLVVQHDARDAEVRARILRRLLPRQLVVLLVAAQRAELIGKLRIVEHRHQLGIRPQAVAIVRAAKT